MHNDAEKNQILYRDFIYINSQQIINKISQNSLFQRN